MRKMCRALLGLIQSSGGTLPISQRRWIPAFSSRGASRKRSVASNSSKSACTGSIESMVNFRSSMQLRSTSAKALLSIRPFSTANSAITSDEPMRRVAQRLAVRGQPVVAEHCLQVAEEESGHDTLALMDLTALGLPAQAFVNRLRPKNALALVDQFSRFADSDQPIAVLGYAYALERMTAGFALAEVNGNCQSLKRPTFN